MDAETLFKYFILFGIVPFTMWILTGYSIFLFMFIMVIYHKVKN